MNKLLFSFDEEHVQSWRPFVGFRHNYDNKSVYVAINYLEYSCDPPLTEDQTLCIDRSIYELENLVAPENGITLATITSLF